VTLSGTSARHITSAQNPRYKLWKSYLKDPASKNNPWIAVEGRKQVLELSKTRIPELLLFSMELDKSGLEDLIKSSKVHYYLPGRLLNRLSSVEHNQGIVSFYEKPSWSRDDLSDRIICLNSLQDPGNLGTIIRTAAALGGFSIVSSGESVSFYNEKVVRASAGYLFSVPFLADFNLDYLREKGYQIWHTFPGNGVPLNAADFIPPLAVVFGSEGKGLNEALIKETEKKLTIPMGGAKDSLNVAVASSLVMYEINRRGFRADG
jgi:RNA methyltransferase, TrmH family